MPSQQSAYPSVLVTPSPATMPNDEAPKSSAAKPKPEKRPRPSSEKSSRLPKGKRKEEDAFTRPIPTLGWPAEQYQLNLLGSHVLKLITGGKVNRTPYVPVMTQHEKERYDVVFLQDKIKSLRYGKRRIVAVLNSKSAGKTAFSDYFAATVAFSTTFPDAVIDTNENNGTTAKLLGVSHGDTIWLRQAIKDRDELKTFDDLRNRAGAHAKYPVFVIASDPNTKDPIDKGHFIETVKIVSHDVGLLTVLDLGNGTSWASNKGSVEVADDLVFVARADDEYDPNDPVASNDTFDNMVSTMWYYAQDFSEKVQKSFVVINAVRKGQDKDYCLKVIRLAAEKIGTSVEELGISKEHMFLIPYSKHVARNRVVDLDPDVLGYPTRIAYSEAAVAILGQDVKKTDVENDDAKKDDGEPVNNSGVITASKEIPSEDEPSKQLAAEPALEGASK